MKRRAWAVVLAALTSTSAAAQQPSPAPPPALTFAAHAGAASFLTRGERREYWAGRATLNYWISDEWAAFGRGDLLATQDGGNLNVLDPTSFRSLEWSVGLRRRLTEGGLSVGLLGGVTFSLEGETGAPVDPRQYTGLAVVRVPVKGEGYAYFGCGWHEPVGGGACVLAMAIPAGGPVSTFIDYRLPFDRNAFRMKTWTLTVGASAKVGEWGL